MRVVVTTRDKRRARAIPPSSSLAVAEGDLRDARFVEDVFRTHKPAVVVHAAWIGVLGKDRNDPAQFENLAIMDSLCGAAGRHGARLVIGFGSQAEYGNASRKSRETDPARPATLYGVCKLAAGQLGLDHSARSGFRYAWLRLFPTFGPGEDPSYQIPYAITSLIGGKAPELTRCVQKLDYLYVRDIPLHLEKIVAREAHFSGIYNLCSSRPVRNKNIILFAKKLLNSPIEPVFGAVPYAPGASLYLAGSGRKFRKDFGKVALTPLRKALEETILWYSRQGRTNGA
jgi:nucleoside-diphosphate-sugar epimerase